MTRHPILVCLFSISFGFFALTTMPVSFFLEKAGLKHAGFSWQTTNGNVLKGGVTGLHFGKQSIGDVALTGNLSSLLKGQIGYSFTWEGDSGQGKGSLSLGRKIVSVSALEADLQLSGIENLAHDIRNLHGQATIRNGSLLIEDGACTQAEGNVSSDMLARLAARYSVAATSLNGELSCMAGALLLKMKGMIAESDAVTTELHLSLIGASSFQAHVETEDVALAIGLADYGFENDTNGLFFRHELSMLKGF